MQALFARLESKRVFVDSLTQEVPTLCVKSVLDVRDDATHCVEVARSKELAGEAQKIVKACNAFLSAAGIDGADFVENYTRFGEKLARFRSVVESACRRLKFDFRLDPPHWLAERDEGF
ncbi:hypothetical protein A5N71_16400 [Prescottella equi]|nr:hypothetical protein A5N71_16400 [Prescottella equi]